MAPKHATAMTCLEAAMLKPAEGCCGVPWCAASEHPDVMLQAMLCCAVLYCAVVCPSADRMYVGDAPGRPQQTYACL